MGRRREGREEGGGRRKGEDPQCLKCVDANAGQFPCRSTKVCTDHARQTLTDNTDIIDRHIIEVTNKMCIHSNRGFAQCRNKAY